MSDSADYLFDDPRPVEVPWWFAASAEEMAEHDREVRAAALEEAAQIADRWVDHYPEDVFLPEGTSVDAQSARVIRHMAPAIGRAIRGAVTETKET